MVVHVYDDLLLQGREGEEEVNEVSGAGGCDVGVGGGIVILVDKVLVMMQRFLGFVSQSRYESFL